MNNDLIVIIHKLLDIDSRRRLERALSIDTISHKLVVPDGVHQIPIINLVWSEVNWCYQYSLPISNTTRSFHLTYHSPTFKYLSWEEQTRTQSRTRLIPRYRKEDNQKWVITETKNWNCMCLYWCQGRDLHPLYVCRDAE